VGGGLEVSVIPRWAVFFSHRHKGALEYAQFLETCDLEQTARSQATKRASVLTDAKIVGCYRV
jgi:hypothetical protein